MRSLVRYRRGLIATAVILTLAPSSPSVACGWWGDGEMSNSSDDAITVDAQGRPIVDQTQPQPDPLPPPIHLTSMKVPESMGYGIAVTDAEVAIPYLEATEGRIVNRIDQLSALGYGAVIDLGTPLDVARKHREETEAAGMRYFNIPIEGDMPTPEQTDLFAGAIVSFSGVPSLVFAPRAELLGMMWVSYRISVGAPLEHSLQEGRDLGITPAQELLLRKLAK